MKVSTYHSPRLAPTVRFTGSTTVNGEHLVIVGETVLLFVTTDELVELHEQLSATLVAVSVRDEQAGQAAVS